MGPYGMVPIPPFPTKTIIGFFFICLDLFLAISTSNVDPITFHDCQSDLPIFISHMQPTTCNIGNIQQGAHKALHVQCKCMDNTHVMVGGNN